MSLTDPSARRLTPVRLTDIPPQLRLRAAHQLLKGVKDGDEAQELLAAAISPSDRTYYVRADAA